MEARPSSCNQCSSPGTPAFHAQHSYPCDPCSMAPPCQSAMLLPVSPSCPYSLPLDLKIMTAAQIQPYNSSPQLTLIDGRPAASLCDVPCEMIAPCDRREETAKVSASLCDVPCEMIAPYDRREETTKVSASIRVTHVVQAAPLGAFGIVWGSYTAYE